MGDKSKIEWLAGGATWNPAYGCSKVSAGCQNCYAHRMISARFPHLTGYEDTVTHYMGEPSNTSDPIGWNGSAHFKPDRLEIPFRWKKPRRIFPCSMSDLFHESLSNEEIAAVFGVMAATPQHQYVVLTKRLQRALEWFQWIEFGLPKVDDTPQLECAFQLLRQAEPDMDGPIHCKYGPAPDAKWPLENVTICASVEHQPAANERIPLLLQIPAKWRGVSVEPMLGPVRLDNIVDYRDDAEWHASALECDVDPEDDGEWKGATLDIVICGSETGPGKRPFKDEWALDLRDQCKTAGTPYFFKKDGAGKPTLCGVEYHEWIGG